eukprot:jgi/Tetstr1/442013/TSEL_030194.t1
MVGDFLAGRGDEVSGEGQPEEVVAAAEGAAPRPMRIHMDFQEPFWRAPSWQASMLQQHVMPQVAAELSRLLSVKTPLRGNLTVPSRCRFYNDYFDALGYYDSDYEEGDLCDNEDTVRWCSKSLDLPHNPAFMDRVATVCDADGCVETSGEGLDTDFLLYVSTGHQQCAPGSLAFAIPCMLDQRTGRPTVGAAFFCDSFFEDSLDLMVQTALHEVMHSLFFSSFLFPIYLNEMGKRRTERRVWERVSLRGASWSGRHIITPRVVEEVQKVSGCRSLGGAPVENDGGHGTESSHWDSRFFSGDLMSGRRGMHMEFVTSLTLALAVDSGWFLADVDAGVPLLFGRDAGCSFWRDSCAQYMKRNPGQRFLCNPGSRGDTTYGCTTLGHRRGICLDNGLLGDGCGTVIADSWYMSTRDCQNPDTRASSRVPFLEYGSNSGCAEIEIAAEGGVAWMSDCISYKCTEGGQLRVSLRLSSDSDKAWVKACPSGEFVDLSNEGYPGVRIGPCPDNESFCQQLSCPGGCGNNGICYKGACHCLPGWVGRNCSSPICTRGACRAGEACDASTGECRKCQAPVEAGEGREGQPKQSCAPPWGSTFTFSAARSLHVSAQAGESDLAQRLEQRLMAARPLSDEEVVSQSEALLSRGDDLYTPGNTTAMAAMGVEAAPAPLAASSSSGSGGLLRTTPGLLLAYAVILCCALAADWLL